MPKSKAKKMRVKTAKKEPQLSLGQKIRKVLLSYFTTQFVLMILVGLGSWGILNLLNVRYSILLGVVTGVLSGIPTYGMFLSTIAATVVAIFDKATMWVNSPAWLEGIIVLAIFFLFNKIVDLVIAPIFLGKTTKVNPLVVLLLVLLGTMFMGVWGAILAVPTYLVVRTVVEHFSSN